MFTILPLLEGSDSIWSTNRRLVQGFWAKKIVGVQLCDIFALRVKTTTTLHARSQSCTGAPSSHGTAKIQRSIPTKRNRLRAWKVFVSWFWSYHKYCNFVLRSTVLKSIIQLHPSFFATSLCWLRICTAQLVSSRFKKVVFSGSCYCDLEYRTALFAIGLLPHYLSTELLGKKGCHKFWWLRIIVSSTWLRSYTASLQSKSRYEYVSWANYTGNMLKQESWDSFQVFRIWLSEKETSFPERT